MKGFAEVIKRSESVNRVRSFRNTVQYTVLGAVERNKVLQAYFNTRKQEYLKHLKKDPRASLDFLPTKAVMSRLIHRACSLG